jgi:hypothetical protein
MDKKLKEKWVKALCSGKYPQGSGHLQHAGRYCCLGVLKAVAPSRFREMYPTENKFLRVSWQGGFLVVPEDAQSALATLNDSHVPFEMIAGLIDEAL